MRTINDYCGASALGSVWKSLKKKNQLSKTLSQKPTSCISRCRDLERDAHPFRFSNTNVIIFYFPFRRPKICHKSQNLARKSVALSTYLQVMTPFDHVTRSLSHMIELRNVTQNESRNESFDQIVRNLQKVEFGMQNFYYTCCHSSRAAQDFQTG